ncbi:hypothetical protein ACWCXX_21945 [Streptomyces sp. NPDC001732]
MWRNKASDMNFSSPCPPVRSLFPQAGPGRAPESDHRPEESPRRRAATRDDGAAWNGVTSSQAAGISGEKKVSAPGLYAVGRQITCPYTVRNTGGTAMYGS